MLDIKKTPLQFSHGGFTYHAVTVEDLRGRGMDEAIILGAVKDRLCADIDTAAEAARGQFITPGVGQSMEYEQTEKQAVAALTTPGSATPELYPMLAATIGVDIDPITGAPAADVLGVARSVIQASDVWGAKGAEIRTVRLQGKAAVRAAATLEAAAAAAKGLAWPTP